MNAILDKKTEMQAEFCKRIISERIFPIRANIIREAQEVADLYSVDRVYLILTEDGYLLLPMQHVVDNLERNPYHHLRACITRNGKILPIVH